MSDKSSIEWTDSTWNPTRGCTKVSPGCKHCYAEAFAERFRGVKGHPYEQGFDLRLVPEALELPLRWTKPRRIFVNSMSDLFHEDVPDDFIAAVFGVMSMCPRHVFQILTKQPERARRWFAWMADLDAHSPGHRMWNALCSEVAVGPSWPEAWEGEDGPPVGDTWPLPNVWLGTSVENQEAADERIPHLLATPAALRFLSCEPLLGPVDLDSSPVGDPLGVCEQCNGKDANCEICLSIPRLDWVIVGGESGPKARPMDEAWVRALRDQCTAAGVSFFYKQRLDARGRKVSLPELDGRMWKEMPRG